MAAANLAYRTGVCHRDRLAAARIVRHRQHGQRNALPTDLGDQRFERLDVHVALERSTMLRIACFWTRQVNRLGPHKLDIRSRGIEVRVIGNHVSLPTHHVEQNAFSGAALMRGDDVPISENLLDGVAEVVEASAAGIAFVTFHYTRPLMGGHRSGTGISKQVDEDVIGRQEEKVVVCRP